MYVRVLADEGHRSQYSKTSLRNCGMKTACPLAGLERSCALKMGLVAGRVLKKEAMRS